MKTLFQLVLIFGISGFVVQSGGNTSNAPDLPISHCYHWLDSTNGFLQFKYAHAEQANGELSFFTTGGNGAIAGPGLYCAKTPSGSYGYGDRIIKIELVQDVVLLDAHTGIKHCGYGATAGTVPHDACQEKNWDIKFYNSSADWYVIQNPNAVLRWTTGSADLAADLEAEKRFGDSAYNRKVDTTIAIMQQDPLGSKYYQNGSARLSLAQLIKRDRNTIQTIPVLQVLGELSVSTAEEALTTPVYNWALGMSLKRFFSDPTQDFEPVSRMLQTNEKMKATTIELAKTILNNTDGFKIGEVNYRSLIYAASMDTEYRWSTIDSVLTKLSLDTESSNRLRLNFRMVSDTYRHAVAQYLQEQSRDLEQNIENYMGHLDLAQKLVAETAYIDTIKAQLNGLIKSKGIDGFGLADTIGQFFPIVGTIQDSIELCEFHIRQNNLSGQIFLKLGETKVPMPQYNLREEPQAYCAKQTGYFQALSTSIAMGKNASIISGQVSGNNFVFVINYVEDLLPQIRQFIGQQGIQSFNTVEFSVNGSDTIRQNRNAGKDIENLLFYSIYPHLSKFGIFTKAQLNAQTQFEQQKELKQFQIQIRFNAQTISLAVDSAEEAMTACLANSAALDLSAIDEITFTVNGGSAVKAVNERSFWQGSQATCSALVQGLTKSLGRKSRR